MLPTNSKPQPTVDENAQATIRTITGWIKRKHEYDKGMAEDVELSFQAQDNKIEELSIKLDTPFDELKAMMQQLMAQKPKEEKETKHEKAAAEGALENSFGKSLFSARWQLICTKTS